tara:strand:+ start:169 stop:300 length:132 start_codon:yes stop_codon:yes gene_type:complete
MPIDLPAVTQIDYISVGKEENEGWSMPIEAWLIPGIMITTYGR